MKLDALLVESLRQKKLTRIVCILTIWALIGLIFASQLYLFAKYTGYKTTVSDVLRWELTRWCLWAVLTPWIVRLVRLYPIQKPRLISKLSRHLLFSIMVSLIHVVLFSLIYWLIKSLIGPIDSKELKPFDVFQYAFSIDFHLGIFVYWSILISVVTVRLYQNAAELQLELTKAQLQALKMQIHPHFLFNTLNSISALLHRDPESADEMVGNLGDFLRLTLQNSGAEEIPLKDEMEFLKCYLEIEQIRFRDRLNVIFELDPETLSAMVPNMLLQPIIENAIKHGIADRTDPAQIEIRSRRQNGKLRITIQDDGPGLTGDLESVNREGIGLSNTRARLNHLYSDDHRFILDNVPGGGLLVTVEIPFIKSERAAAENSH